MSVKHVQKVVKEHLKAHFPGFDIESWKKDVKEYDLLAPHGAVILRYVKSSFSEPRVLNHIIQTEEMMFVAVLVTRDIQDDEATTNHFDTLKQLLIGFETEPSHRITLKDAQFLYESQGLYWHGVVFTLPTDLIEERHELTAPTLTDARFLQKEEERLKIT